MGRYYYTNNSDFDGKFWFGVQSSDDPERVYGMRLSGGVSFTENFVDYDADEQDNERIMTELDKQFTLLGVPRDKRRYRFDSGEEVGAYVWDDLNEFFLQDEPKKHPNSATHEDIPYSFGDDERKWPISSAKVEAASRVDLGLRILNDIRIHGACHMTAEF